MWPCYSKEMEEALGYDNWDNIAEHCSVHTYSEYPNAIATLMDMPPDMSIFDAFPDGIWFDGLVFLEREVDYEVFPSRDTAIVHAELQSKTHPGFLIIVRQGSEEIGHFLNESP